jgi:hypothetical protein
MSNYGPPGGPYPGQPPDPWPDRQPEEPYGPASDPWGQDPWSTPDSMPPTSIDPSPDYPNYREPGYAGDGPGQRYEPAYPPYPPAGPDPKWAQRPPPPPAPKRRGGLIVGILVGLAIVVCAGGATAWNLLGSDDKPKASQPSATPSVEPSVGQPLPPGTPGATTAAPAPESSTDARFVKVGQCVQNGGATSEPKLAITSCAPKTYEVLQRFEGPTNGESDATAKCAKVEGYTNWYFFNSELDVLDFVLCLKLR